MRLLFIVFLVIVSCNNLKKTEKEKLIKPKLSNDSVLDESETAYSHFENDVFEAIEKIKNSHSNDRKDLLEKFVTYSKFVDGAISEGYSSFAFDYPNENIFEFFSVLTINDTIFLSKWAVIASSELMLIKENIENPNEFEINFQKEIEDKIDKKLNPDQKVIAKFYFEKLMKYSI